MKSYLSSQLKFAILCDFSLSCTWVPLMIRALEGATLPRATGGSEHQVGARGPSSAAADQDWNYGLGLGLKQAPPPYLERTLD